MKHQRLAGTVVLSISLASAAAAQDWPQWRGPNRDARAAGFTAPKSWPKDLAKKWRVTVGDGVATPALVGDKLYVFTREGGDEVIRCLNAGNGDEIWKDKYASGPGNDPQANFTGPRASPAVADGKVVAHGVRGILSCYDAASGKRIWQKNEFPSSMPMFATASSPVIVGTLCIAQVGGDRGGIVAYDLATGDQKWKWSEDGTAYASPNLLEVDGIKAIVAMTNRRVVALELAGGKLLWDTPFEAGRGGFGGGGGGGGGGGMRGGGPPYNACTPVVDGQTVIFSGNGRGTTAVKLEKKGDKLADTQLWKITDTAVKFNTPVIKDGTIFGLSEGNNLFAISADTGKTAWTAPAPAGAGGGGGGRPPGPPGGRPGGRPGGGMGMGMQGGYGSIVDAGSVLFALTPAAQLLVFEPNGKQYRQIASYKVADGNTYAYPVISGNRIFIKDRDSLTLWAIE
jgi:outer membrane protein assembly factor BamB